MKKMRSNITFIIFTKNEENRIEYPIKNFSPYGQILISDDYSNDKTVEIAKRLGAKVVKRQTHLPLVENKIETDFLFKYVKTEWVYWGFVDNMIPKSCLELYKKISQENKYKIVVQKTKNFFYDKEHEYFPLNITHRFFKKDAIDFTDNTIHQMGKFASHVKPSEALYLPLIDEYAIYHFSLDNTETRLSKINMYSNIHIVAKDPKRISSKIILNAIYQFFFAYIFGKAYRHGTEGVVIAAQYALYPLVYYSKLYEKHNGITLDAIERSFTQQKKKLLTYSPKTNIIDRTIGKLLVIPVAYLHKRFKFKQQMTLNTRRTTEKK